MSSANANPVQTDSENFDTEPSFTQAHTINRRTLRLTPEGIVFLVILGFIVFGAILRNVNLLIVLAGMMVSAITLNWRSANLKLKTLSGTRELPARVYAGKLLSVIWRVENQGPQRNWNINVDDQIDYANAVTADDTDPSPNSKSSLSKRISASLGHSKRIQTNKVRLNFPQISPYSNESNIYHCLLNQRGRYRVGPSKITTTFPFGLIKVELEIDNRQIIFAAPPTGKLVPNWEQRAAAMATGSESIKRKRGNTDDEFFALRQWRSGDNRKNIHWRTTAKMQHPMVRQFDEPRNRDLAIVIDLFQPNPSDDGQSSQNDAQRIETVLSFASTIAAKTNHQIDGQTSIAISGHTSEVFRKLKRKKTNADLIRCLAMAKGDSNPDLIGSITSVGESVSAGTPIFIISTRPQPDWIEQLGSVPDQTLHNSSNAVFEALAGQDLQLGRLTQQIRWIDANSDSFEALFSVAPTGDQSRIDQFQKRWNS